MKQIVWVFGTSAVGKETFMRWVAGNSGTDLVRDLGLSGKIVLSKESLLHTGHVDDPLTKQRVAILPEVAKLLKTFDTVLVKWQYADSIMNLPNLLRSELPLCRHRIVLVYATNETTQERLVTKPWWQDTSNPAEHVERERHLVLGQVKKLSPRFSTVIVDTTTGSYSFLMKLKSPLN